MSAVLGFRQIDHSGWVRDEEGYTSGGYPLVIHVADRCDTTPAHKTYPQGYDSRCGWCYLGANHSEAAHALKVHEAQQ